MSLWSALLVLIIILVVTPFIVYFLSTIQMVAWVDTLKKYFNKNNKQDEKEN